MNPQEKFEAIWNKSLQGSYCSQYDSQCVHCLCKIKYIMQVKGISGKNCAKWAVCHVEKPPSEMTYLEFLNMVWNKECTIK